MALYCFCKLSHVKSLRRASVYSSPCRGPVTKSLRSLIDERFGDTLCVSRGKRPCNLRSEAGVLLTTGICTGGIKAPSDSFEGLRNLIKVYTPNVRVGPCISLGSLSPRHESGPQIGDDEGFRPDDFHLLLLSSLSPLS